MLMKLRSRMGRDEGFTLIELLVVMLILGILAAIAIPTFFNQRQKAQDADAKAAARAAQTAMETYATDNGGSYVGADLADLQAIESTIQATGDNAISVVGTPTATNYTVRATSATGRTFDVVRAGGTFTFPCAAVGGGCPSGGWGG
jgi:prepilin-type N-terminal cleavage/methylation domain-containing protein